MDRSDEFHGQRTEDKRIKSGCNYLNKLPDEILVEILSRLNVKEAARTCVVSRRWRNLWTSSTTYEGSTSSYLSRFDEYKSSGAMVVRYKKRVNLMDSVILAFDTAQHVDPHDYSGLNNSYVVKGECLPSVRLRNATLTALYLNSVILFDYYFENLLYWYPNLETLSVENLSLLHGITVECEGKDELKLKHLEIRYCKNLRNISNYSAPNLVSLKLAREGGGDIFLHGNFSKLSSISLEGTFSNNIISEIQKAATLLEQLELNMDLIHGMSVTRSLEFPEFKNVRTLKLIFDFSSEANNLMNLALIIMACPSMQKLTLVYGVRKEYPFRRENDSDPKYIHFDDRWTKKSYRLKHLQVVEFLGWCGYQNEVRFAEFVIKTAIHLQELVFDPSTPQHVDRSGARTFEQGNSMDKNALESASLLMEKFKMIRSSKSSRP